MLSQRGGLRSAADSALWQSLELDDLFRDDLEFGVRLTVGVKLERWVSFRSRFEGGINHHVVTAFQIAKGRGELAAGAHVKEDRARRIIARLGDHFEHNGVLVNPARCLVDAANYNGFAQHWGSICLSLLGSSQAVKELLSPAGELRAGWSLQFPPVGVYTRDIHAVGGNPIAELGVQFN